METKETEFEIYTLTICNIWDPVENGNFWKATLEVPDILSLAELHYFIQKTISFGNDHLYDFYAGRTERNRKVVFCEDAGYPDESGCYDDIRLNDIYPFEFKGLKLYYLFDFGDNWIFEIRKSRKKVKPVQENTYPRVVSGNGVKLIQYPVYGF